MQRQARNRKQKKSHRQLFAGLCRDTCQKCGATNEAVIHFDRVTRTGRPTRTKW